MVNNALNQNYFHRLASVQTMGYISEFMEDDRLTPEQVSQILNCTINNIQACQPQICVFALQSFNRTLPQTKLNFENDQQRDFIMNAILQACLAEEP